MYTYRDINTNMIVQTMTRLDLNNQPEEFTEDVFAPISISLTNENGTIYRETVPITGLISHPVLGPIFGLGHKVTHVPTGWAFGPASCWGWLCDNLSMIAQTEGAWMGDKDTAAVALKPLFAAWLNSLDEPSQGIKILPTNRIVRILMKRDGMSEEEAVDLVRQATEDLNERLAQGEMPEDICEEWFGLEPDYILDIM